MKLPSSRLLERRVVAQMLVVDIEIDRVETEAVHAPVKPEPDRVENRHSAHPDCESSDPAATPGNCACSTAAGPCPIPRPVRRKSTASCWARCHRAWDRPRRTSRPWRLSRLDRLSLNQGCWSEECEITWSMMILSPFEHGPVRPTRQSPKACRTSDRHRNNPTRHNRNRPLVI
jgi:hypothetical protein